MSTRRSRKGKPQFVYPTSASHSGATPPNNPLPLTFPSGSVTASSLTSSTSASNTSISLNPSSFGGGSTYIPGGPLPVQGYPSNVTNLPYTHYSDAMSSFGTYLSREQIIEQERAQLATKALIAALGEAVKLAREAREHLEEVMARHHILPAQLSEGGLADDEVPHNLNLTDAYALFHAHTLLRYAEEFAGDPAVNSTVAMINAMKETTDAVVESDCLEAIAAWLALADDSDSAEVRQINRMLEARMAYSEMVERERNAHRSPK